jgi:hypothetical protein
MEVEEERREREIENNDWNGERENIEKEMLVLDTANSFHINLCKNSYE